MVYRTRVVLAAAMCWAQAQADIADPSTTISQIAFGSCNMEGRSQPIWDSIVNTKPEIFVWLGDAIYGDKGGLVRREPSTISEMKEKYAVQSANPNYQNLVKKVPHVLGTWDDHDFGQNNGDSGYLDRDASKDLFLNFLKEPRNTPRRSRKGMYQAYTFGKVGKQVTIILLDGRYFKNEEEGALLGEAQWKWLDQTFADTPDSQLYLIGSGIQVLPTDKIIGEKWATYPSERARLIESIKQANLTGVVSLLSGDVHLAELNCMEAGLTHPLLEVTSSGLTHAWGSTGEFSFVPTWLSYLSRFLSYVLPSRYQLNTIEYQRNISNVHGLNYYLDLNFGSVSIDWESQNFTVGIHNLEGEVVFDHTVSFNKTAFQSEYVTCDEHSPAREYIGPHLARSIVLALVAIASLDVWLVVYLGYLFIQWMLFPDDSEVKKEKTCGDHKTKTKAE